MPSPQSGVDSYQLSLLKEAVEKKFGFAVLTKADCDKLTDCIENHGKEYISVNTLRRFFEVMPSGSNPSLETLNILSRFCGFNDYFEFKKLHIADSPLNGNDLSIDAINDLQQALGESPRFYSTFNWLMLLAFRQHNVQFLRDFFIADCLRYRNDYPREMARKLLFSFSNQMRANPKLFEQLIPHYAKQTSAQGLYFEWFVDYDYLNIRHHKAIRAYANERQDDDGRLFSLCLLFLHHFWLLQKKECEELIQKINQIKLKPETHPFPAGRKFACNILFQKYFRNGVESDLKKSIEEFERSLPRAGGLERNLPSFHLMIAEAFSMTDLHEDVLHYSQLAQQNYIYELNQYSQGVLIPMRLYEALALANLNRKEEAIKLAQRNNPATLDSAIREYHRMQYFKIMAAASKGLADEMKFKSESKRIAKQQRFLFFERSI